MQPGQLASPTSLCTFERPHPFTLNFVQNLKGAAAGLCTHCSCMQNTSLCSTPFSSVLSLAVSSMAKGLGRRSAQLWASLRRMLSVLGEGTNAHRLHLSGLLTCRSITHSCAVASFTLVATPEPKAGFGQAESPGALRHG